MTIKELADFTGKDERTIRRWIQKASDRMSSLTEKTREAHRTKCPMSLTVDEVEAILNAGSLSKDAVSILMDNARNKRNNQVAEVDYETIGKMIGMAVSAALKPIVDQLDGIQNNKTVKSLPAPPEISLRDRLRKSINEYSVNTFDGDRKEAWNSLYQEIYYRMHRNIRLSANNRGISKIDYLEKEGLLLNSIAIVEELIGA